MPEAAVSGRGFRRPRRRRYGRWVVAALLAGPIVLAATLPWWWGAALRAGAETAGVDLGAYSVVGYARWTVEDVQVRRPGWIVRVDRLEAPHPLAWWWRRSAAGPVVVDGWRVERGPGEADGVGEPVTPDEVGRMLAGVLAWLPATEAGNGVIDFGGGESPLRIDQARWDGARLRVRGVAWREARANLTATLSREPDGNAVVEFEASEAAGDGSVSGRASALNRRIDAEGWWRGQRVTARADFGGGGWMPEVFHVTADDWSLPGTTFAWSEGYATLTGSLTASWVREALTVRLRADGVPREAGGLPPLRVVAEGDGDRNGLRIVRLEATLPGVRAALDRPVTWTRDDPGIGLVSNFQLQANLADIPGSGMAGRVDGALMVVPQPDGWPRITAEMELRGVAVAAWPAGDGRMRAEIQWPNWEVSALEWAGPEIGRLHAQGRGNLEAKTVEEGTWSVSVPGAPLARWLPEAVAVGTVEGRGTVAGTWPELRHGGSWAAETVVAGPLRPLTAAGEWEGVGGRVAATARLSSGPGHLDIALRREGNRIDVERLEILRGAEVWWRLGQTATVRLGPDWVVEGVVGRGTAGELTVPAWSASRGVATVRLEPTDLPWLADWWQGDGPIKRIDTLRLETEWTPERVEFAAEVDATLTLERVGEVRVAANLVSRAGEIRIDRLTLGRADRDMVRLTGSLPVGLHFADGRPGWSGRDGPLALSLVSVPDAEFWAAVGEATGLKVTSPEVVLELAGTWQEPRATGRVQVGEVRWTKPTAGTVWPVLTELDVRLTSDAAGVVAETLTARIDGQPVTLSGRLPVTLQDWQRLRDEPWQYLREQGSARVEMPALDLAAVARLVPDYLVPTGEGAATLTFSPGGRVAGELVLRGAVSRPLGPLGALQDIEVALVFEDRIATLRSARAVMGGQAVSLSGQVEWPAQAGPARLDLRLQGTNLPLVRQTGLLLRSDVDLQVTSDETGRGRVEGVVRLREGLMLADIRSLVPTGGSERRSGRPPYFSVEQAPFAEWTLALNVEGDQFMRLRTPVVTGLASGTVRIDGTLRSPRAVGEVTLDEGRLRLPFATFVIEEAYARLTEMNPYEPEIFLRGRGARFGYELEMELTGSAARPQLQLTAEPGLPAADVLLLVMAGVVPRDDARFSSRDRALQLGVYLGQELVGGLLGWESDGRLAVTSGEKLSRQGKETYRFDYRLNERWSLLGEYDEFDDYNAGVRWRWMPAPRAEADAEVSDAP